MNSTEPPSKTLASPVFIAKPLKASKNSFDRGLAAEAAVIKHYSKQGYICRNQRVKTPFAEVDLVFSKENSLFLVEVKSISNWNFFEFRLSKSQRQRLIRALAYYQSRGFESHLHFAVVSQQGEIKVFTDFFG